MIFILVFVACVCSLWWTAPVKTALLKLLPEMAIREQGLVDARRHAGHCSSLGKSSLPGQLVFSGLGEAALVP